MLTNLLGLERKHRVSLLVPTTEYWWHGYSAQMFTAFVQEFIKHVRMLSLPKTQVENKFKYLKARYIKKKR